jgi:hypothetical protein
MPAVGGVLVSNGREIVETNPQGHFVIDLHPHQVLFVIKPAGYQLRLDETGLSTVFVAYSDSLPDSVDFNLEQSDSSDKFGALILGDPQPSNLQEVKYLKARLAQIDPKPFHLGFGMGDMVHDDVSLLPEVNKAIATLKLPWHNIPGNHDADNHAFKGEASHEEKYHLAFAPFRKHHGVTTHIAQYGKAHFIFLNDIIFPHRETYSNPLECVGGLSDDQFHLLEQYLERISNDDLIVVVMHIPIYNGDVDSQEFRSEDRHRLLQLLSPFPHTLSISGHSHVNQDFFIKQSEDLGWTRDTPHHHWNVGTVCGSRWQGEINNGIPDSPLLDGKPSGYGSLQIDGIEYTSTFHPFF